ncbi:MAG: GNAT family N-acetyltransferase [Rickettsiales bacterium]|jgi:N-acetylglutamate synthase-like GNAT family acetyltransferase|nr:GNAT family N-acetyltransferase [Rickettsiales bacterium]
MNTKISVRRARITDLEALTDLLVRFNKFFQGLDNGKSRIHRKQVSDEIRRVSFGDRPLLYIYVAELDGKIIGAISMYNGWTTDTSTMFHVPYLFVYPEFRGSRAVLALFFKIRDLAKKTKVGRICFSVYGKNSLTKKLYEHAGAKYWADDDEHFMYFNL